METDLLNGRQADVNEHADDEAEASRDPSRLPVTNLEAYKSWCKRVKDDWEEATEQ